MDKSCNHSPHFYPRAVDVPRTASKWKFWIPSYVTYRWFCQLCGVEMEPVFKVTEKENK